jgi:hypothetical protein
MLTGMREAARAIALLKGDEQGADAVEARTAVAGKKKKKSKKDKRKHSEVEEGACSRPASSPPCPARVGIWRWWRMRPPAGLPACSNRRLPPRPDPLPRPRGH